MDKNYHLITDEEKVIHFQMNFNNETVILLKGKVNGGVHILTTESSSFQKNEMIETKNEVLEFIQHTHSYLEKEDQFDVILLSEKILKSTIDFLRDKINYSKIYLFEYGDIFYPKQTIQHVKEPIDIIYQVQPSILQVSGFSSSLSSKREYHIFYDELWSEVPESLFK